MIGPFVFAVSIVNAYRDLYLQWISKFVSVSLYGAIAHIAIMLAFILIDFGLGLDIAFLNQTLEKYQTGGPDGTATVIGLFIQSNTGGFALVVAAATGIIGLLATPLISTWILGSNSTTQVANKAITVTSAAIK